MEERRAMEVMLLWGFVCECFGLAVNWRTTDGLSTLQTSNGICLARLRISLIGYMMRVAVAEPAVRAAFLAVEMIAVRVELRVRARAMMRAMTRVKAMRLMTTAKLSSVTLLDWVVFLFFVRAIRQYVGGNVYANLPLCFCAVLGIKMRSLGYAELHLYVGMLAALLRCCCILMLGVCVRRAVA